jgi:hypothetical protein
VPLLAQQRGTWDRREVIRTFWIQGRRAKRCEPTPAEIAVRRAELLAELVESGGAGGVS